MPPAEATLARPGLQRRNYEHFEPHPNTVNPPSAHARVQPLGQHGCLWTRHLLSAYKRGERGSRISFSISGELVAEEVLYFETAVCTGSSRLARSTAVGEHVPTARRTVGD